VGSGEVGARRGPLRPAARTAAGVIGAQFGRVR